MKCGNCGGKGHYRRICPHRMKGNNHCLPVAPLLVGTTETMAVTWRYEDPEAGPSGWENMCDDVRRVILRKLSLRSLARAAPICREFKKAYLDKAAEERAHLVSVGKETYGKDAVSALVEAIHRPMCGSPPCASLFPEPGSSELCHPATSNSIVCFARTPTYFDRQDVRLQKRLLSHGCAIAIRKPLDVPPVVGRLFSAGLCHRRVGDQLGSIPHLLRLEMYESGTTYVNLELVVHKNVAAAAMGLLLIICTENPEGWSSYGRCPLRIVLICFGLDGGAAGERQAEDLVAPMRPLVESVRFSRRGFSAPLFVERLRLDVKVHKSTCLYYKPYTDLSFPTTWWV